MLTTTSMQAEWMEHVLLSRIIGKRYIYFYRSDAQLNRHLVSINSDDFSKSKLDVSTLGCVVDILQLIPLLCRVSTRKDCSKKSIIERAHS